MNTVLSNPNPSNKHSDTNLSGRFQMMSSMHQRRTQFCTMTKISFILTLTNQINVSLVSLWGTTAGLLHVQVWNLPHTHALNIWGPVSAVPAVMKPRGDGSKMPSQSTEEEPPSLALHVPEQHMCRTRPPDLMSERAQGMCGVPLMRFRPTVANVGGNVTRSLQLKRLQN